MLVARDDTYVVAQHVDRIVPSVPLRHPRKIARGVPGLDAAERRLDA